MPKFIGRTIPGATRIQDNAPQLPTRIRLSYSQARLLPPEHVLCSLDTTDRGYAGTLAKRWYRWFAPPEAILACPRATARMLQLYANQPNRQDGTAGTLAGVST